jgi:hypothetical protein
MVEDHRRVEPRQIVGSGMATDPERIERITDDAARRERAWRPSPATSFGAVLQHTPARSDPAHDEARHPSDRPDAEPGFANDGERSTSEPEVRVTPKPTAKPARRLLRATVRGPDPRERLLHAQLEARAATERSASRSNATPSGTGPRRPGS